MVKRSIATAIVTVIAIHTKIKTGKFHNVDYKTAIIFEKHGQNPASCGP